MDSISYVFIYWTIHGMWIIYITFERGGPKFLSTTARALVYRTAVQQRQLRAKWLLCSTIFFCVHEFINPLNAELNPICHLLALLGVHHFLHFSRIRVKTESQLTLLHSCALRERSSGGILKFRTSSFKCYVDHSHTLYSSGNIDVRNWVHLFESRCIFARACA
jgi:hypothetical protein